MTSSTFRSRRAALGAIAASAVFLAACSSASEETTGAEQTAVAEQSPSTDASADSQESTGGTDDSTGADSAAGEGTSAQTQSQSQNEGSGDQEAGSQGEGSNPDGDPDEPAAGALSGSYVDYATYTGDKAKYHAGDVVLFFNASWCPTCQTANANFQSASFPEGVTLVSVDFDSNQDLRQQYGVTTQHTFVAVDGNGKELSKWTGSNNVDEVLSNL